MSWPRRGALGRAGPVDRLPCPTDPFSLQGALQLKRDFDVVRDVMQSDDYELPTEMKQLVFSLRAFQQTDNAIACLVQQPSKAALPSHSWDALHKCCECAQGWEAELAGGRAPVLCLYGPQKGALNSKNTFSSHGVLRTRIWSRGPGKGPSPEEVLGMPGPQTAGKQPPSGQASGPVLPL